MSGRLGYVPEHPSTLEEAFVAVAKGTSAYRTLVGTALAGGLEHLKDADFPGKARAAAADHEVVRRAARPSSKAPGGQVGRGGEDDAGGGDETQRDDQHAENHVRSVSAAARDADDAPVRLVLAFEGDRSRFSAKNAMLSELARALTGEEMPYATLMYVWCNKRAPGTVVRNPRTDRIRKLVDRMEIFGEHGPIGGYSMGGRTDPQIVRELMRLDGHDDAWIDARMEELLDKYATYLARELATGLVHVGGTVVDAAAPLERIPLLVRVGAPDPFGGDGRS